MVTPVSSVQPVTVEKWSTEVPFTVMVGLFAALFWFAIIISIFGAIYGFFLALVFFIGHVMFVSHVRGNGIKIGPNQFPELHKKIGELAAKFGMKNVPEAYLIQAGGTLNAMATKMLNANMLILYTDLLEACEDDTAARDMILAHELGHIHAGHLKWHWFLAPGMLIPFLGTALSRAREYTCDRYGLVGAANKAGALKGLTILAAGAKYASAVNLPEFVKQQEMLNTGWMTIGMWLSTHPPLNKRIAALDEQLAGYAPPMGRGVARALILIGSVYFLPLIVMLVMIFAMPSLIGKFGQKKDPLDPFANLPLQDKDSSRGSKYPPLLPGSDLDVLVQFIEAEKKSPKGYPMNQQDVEGRWKNANPNKSFPVEASSGHALEYHVLGDLYYIYGKGPDGELYTEDDGLYSAPIK